MPLGFGLGWCVGMSWGWSSDSKYLTAAIPKITEHGEEQFKLVLGFDFSWLFCGKCECKCLTKLLQICIDRVPYFPYGWLDRTPIASCSICWSLMYTKRNTVWVPDPFLSVTTLETVFCLI